MEFIIQGYLVVCRDRDLGRRGCVTFIKKVLSNRMLGRGVEQEYVVERRGDSGSELL